METQLMPKHYDLRKIYTLLAQSFDDTDLYDFLLLTPEFRPAHTQLPPAPGKDDLLRLLFEHAQQTDQFDLLLAWAKEQNPVKYANLSPYDDDPHSPG